MDRSGSFEAMRAGRGAKRSEGEGGRGRRRRGECRDGHRWDGDYLGKRSRGRERATSSCHRQCPHHHLARLLPPIASAWDLARVLPCIPALCSALRPPAIARLSLSLRRPHPRFLTSLRSCSRHSAGGHESTNLSRTGEGRQADSGEREGLTPSGITCQSRAPGRLHPLASPCK